MTDFLADTRSEIEQRIAQLDQERKQLEVALEALGKVSSAPSGGTSSTARRRSPGRPKRGPGRPKGSGRKAASKPSTGASAAGPIKRKGKRGRQPTRANEAINLIKSKPGITIREMADTMKIHPNYLYRVMPKLQTDGLVKKRGKGWIAGPAAN